MIKQISIPLFLLLTLQGFAQTNIIPTKDSTPQVADNRPKTALGNLYRDDPQYNPRYSIGGTLLRVTATNAFNWALNHYIFKAEWTNVSAKTWKENWKKGWEWDADRFGTNFLGHPHSGSNYYNVARSRGYTYWGSVPFAIFGSAEWEWFGENTRPSKNDLMNTPLSGAFLGEVLYRISSTILDDRARGAERVWREIFAGLIDPTRAINRFTQKKMFRVTPYEVYQKEPLNITVSAGAHRENVDNKFWTGGTNAIVNLQFDYGTPFERRSRKPFDIFRLRLEGRYGSDKKIIDNVLGYGFLFGKNAASGKNGLLMGVFQQYDYWNNKIFEMGSLGFGPGILSKINLGKNSDLYTGLHLAAVPVGATNTRFGPDTSQVRDYRFAGGYESRIEERLNIGNRLSVGFNGYYYWLYNYEHSKGRSHVGILKPFATIRLINNLSIGFEHHIYYDNRFFDDATELHLRRTEQKVFLQLFFEDRDRHGKYH